MNETMHKIAQSRIDAFPVELFDCEVGMEVPFLLTIMKNYSMILAGWFSWMSILVLPLTLRMRRFQI